MESWQKLGSKVLAQTKIFDVYANRMRSSSGVEDDFYYIKISSWANIVALTPDNNAVLVEQHRFGIAGPSLEVPGGVMDPGEDALTSAMRELREETGYDADSVEPLGWLYPNPALMDNKMHYFLARGARLTGEQKLDPLENIQVRLAPLAEVSSLIRTGAITHSLTIAAFMMLAVHLGDPLCGLAGLNTAAA